MTGSTLELSTGPAHPAQVEAPAWTRQLDLVRRMVADRCSDDEFAVFVAVAQRSGLDPFAKQIHAIVRKGRMSIQTGIDGYRLIADRTGCYMGNDDPVFAANDDGEIVKATVTVWKLVQGQRCPFTASAYWDEYYPGDGADGFMWRKMPHTMLAKVAEALALRKAFPADLSGVLTNEEMAQADRVPDPEPDPFDGWEGGREEHDARYQAITARARTLGDEDRARLKARMEESRIGRPPWSPHVMGVYDRLVAEFEPVDGELVEGDAGEAAWSEEDERPFEDEA